MEYLDQTLGQLAAELPGATALFNTHQLDFCCGGRQSLRQALAAAKLEPAPILAQLAALATSHAPTAADDWRNAPDRELIAHLLSRFHAVHREQLPELERLARKVEQVHGKKADCPHGLADHLYAMHQALEGHMRKEEMVLFPMLERGMGRMAGAPISVMRGEHDDHGVELRRLDALTNHQQPPANACGTWRALYAGIARFREDLMTHIHLENNVLFERYPAVAVA